MGADALSADVDDGAGRGEEGPAALPVTERGEAAPDGVEVGTGVPPQLRGGPPQELHAGQDGSGGDDAEDLLGAGQGGGPQDEVDLSPEPTARDQHEAVDPLGEEVVELHRDAAAERVADERDAVDAQVVQQVAQRGSMGAEGVVAQGLGRVSVTEEVREQHPVVVVELVHESRPLPLRAEDAVDEQEHRARTRVDVGQLVAVEAHRAWSRAGHGCLPQRSAIRYSTVTPGVPAPGVLRV